MTQYYVETFSHSRAWNPEERIAVDSREAGEAMLREMADRFQCANLTSDDINLPVVISRNHPNPYFARERDAAYAWDTKNPSWRSLWV